MIVAGLSWQSLCGLMSARKTLVCLCFLHKHVSSRWVMVRVQDRVVTDDLWVHHNLLIISLFWKPSSKLLLDGAGKNVQVGSCPASPAKLGLCVAAVEAWGVLLTWWGWRCNGQLKLCGALQTSTSRQLLLHCAFCMILYKICLYFFPKHLCLCWNLVFIVQMAIVILWYNLAQNSSWWLFPVAL